MHVFHSETVRATPRDGVHPPEVDVQAVGLSTTLALPESLGGVPRERTSNPEQLFGGAYAGCMVFAIEHAARTVPSNLNGLSCTAVVRIGRGKDRANHLEVDLDVHLPAMEQPEAEALARVATRFCPFHQAIEGNVDATFRVHGAPPAS